MMNSAKEWLTGDDFDDDDNGLDGFEGRPLFEHYRFTVDKGQSTMRLDRFLTARLEDTSRSRVQQAAASDYILVNGLVARSNYMVKPLDEISIVLPFLRRGIELLSEDIPLDVVYEDDDLMVINKAAGMVVHPGHGNYTGTLMNALKFYLKDIPDKEAALAHRIDKNTSGLLLVAKNEQAHAFLAQQFFEHTTKRVYVALVWGNVEKDEGTVDAAIARDPKDRLCFTIVPEEKGGKWAVTHYKVIERIGYVTLIECRLETGRTHQIRVHMDSIGHPLFNDDRYGGSKIVKGVIFSKYRRFVDNCFSIMPRHALHARLIGFVHPTTKEEMIFEQAPPEDFTRVLEKWKNYSTNNEG
ncbi:MAG: RluA family pseudouridine synthase [Bacteroidales bacterium]|nr:RluA family pseudouridine synthase [Bacteroidales bacterium]MCL2133545.1 RluA family pseudouridine synthase [Bacteroidales bacterium]